VSALHIHLFDRFYVERDHQVVTGLEAGKVQELFSYLLIYRDRRHLRESLANLLWAESSSSQSKKYLRQTLWQLQSAIDPDESRASRHTLLVDPDSVRLNHEADLQLDIGQFELAYAQVQGVSGRDLTSERANDVIEAIGVYSGQLLIGWYQSWCLQERERFQEMYLAMLDKLMNWCESRHDYDGGLGYGERLLHFDRARERTHRQLMRLRYLAGDRTGAIHQYERCTAALDQELGVKPSRRTLALYEQIRADRLKDSAPPTTDAAAASARKPANLVELLGRLKKLGVLLADAQRQLQTEIHSVEQVINDRD
jgi:DNA-binding SARP family transcriptional activator